MAATPKFWSALMSASIFPASTSFAPARDRSSKVMRFAAAGACCCAGADAVVAVGVTEAAAGATGAGAEAVCTGG